MYNRGRQSRYVQPIGIGEPIANIRSAGTMGIIQADPMKEEVYMFAGIDGTGVYDEQTYKKNFATSFVKHFTQQRKGYASKREYIRGPGIVGNSTYRKAKKLYKIIKEQFLSHYEDGYYLKVMLAGYSRGGVAVCAVAKLLNEDNIPVHGLFLFDPVDRTPTIWGKDTIIPKNVSYVYRTQRKSTVSSRVSFGTDCKSYWNGQAVHTDEFLTTHGGMGGCPWGKAGEAKYYNVKTFIISKYEPDGYFDTIGKYYKKPPPGGVLDNTKPAVIDEGFPDGITTLSAAMEEIGYMSAQRHYKVRLDYIIDQKACLHKLKIYEVALARKKRYKEAREDLNYNRNYINYKL